MNQLTILTHARLATMHGDGLGIINDGALAMHDGKIAWVGPSRDLPAEFRTVEASDCKGAVVTPGLIDCHTHLVFAGNRAAEFAMRAEGKTYEEIARAGGGIVSTVRATRAADDEALLAESEPRFLAMLREGVTTIEIKSGYGLDLETEMKMLRVARALGERHGIGVCATFLGLHAVPPEFAGRQADYVRHVCEDMLPAVAHENLADAVDAFCESIGFTPAETRAVFDGARALGLPVKLHAEQLSNQHGAELAAGFGALSADHLEHLDEAGIAAMKQSGTVAVLLPTAFYVLRETKFPPIAGLRAAAVPFAVASDLNPGTAPVVSLQAAMHMAATLFRLTPTEVLRGVTVNAARAL
ncbi:MAG: imidazolonepropionase, partial [Betaproteobacteria bacterium]|nr:imidazolonepropionase [Betaproteobacteria bacterium]